MGHTRGGGRLVSGAWCVGMSIRAHDGRHIRRGIASVRFLKCARAHRARPQIFPRPRFLTSAGALARLCTRGTRGFSNSYAHGRLCKITKATVHPNLRERGGFANSPHRPLIQTYTNGWLCKITAHDAVKIYRTIFHRCRPCPLRDPCGKISARPRTGILAKKFALSVLTGSYRGM